MQGEPKVSRVKNLLPKKQSGGRDLIESINGDDAMNSNTPVAKHALGNNKSGRPAQILLTYTINRIKRYVQCTMTLNYVLRPQ